MKYFIKFLIISNFVFLSLSIQQISSEQNNLNPDIFKIDEGDVQFHDTPSLNPKLSELESSCVGKYSKIKF